MKYLTKKEARAQFMELYAEKIKTLSKTDRRCYWIDYVEALRRDKLIRENQSYSWTNIFK